MTIKSRKFLFLILTAAFLVISPLIIFYSQGYRLDFKNLKLTKTGAFYANVLPKSGEILINDKITAKTDFFFGSKLIENLIPKTYSFEIRKEGYSSWKKNLKVKAMMTTEAKNIILFPVDLGLKEITANVKNVFPAPSGKKAILEKQGSQGWYLTALEFKNNLEEILAEEKDFSRKDLSASQLLSLQWSADSQKAIISIGLGEAEKRFLLNLPNDKTPVSLDQLGLMEKIVFDSSDSKRFYLLKENNLYSGDFAFLKSVKIAVDVLDFSQENKNLYFLKTDGVIYKFNEPNQPLLQKPLEIVPESRYLLATTGKNIFLIQNNGLFWLDQKNQQLIQIAKQANYFKESADHSKITFLNNGEINIHFLKEKIEQIEENQGQDTLLARFSENIGQVFWLNNDYLVFTLGDKIKATETDSRDQINIADLAKIKNPKIYFDKDGKRIFVLSQEKLFLSEKILP